MDATLTDWNNIRAEFTTGSLLLGNGSSRAVWEPFGYRSLYEQALHQVDHPLTRQETRLFTSLGTTNFEAVLSAVRTAEIVCTALDVAGDVIQARHQSVRVALMEAVRGIHIPWALLPSSVRESMKRELARYSYVFSTNYDLLIYWAPYV
jgi:hypothetical protein